MYKYNKRNKQTIKLLPITSASQLFLIKFKVIYMKHANPYNSPNLSILPTSACVVSLKNDQKIPPIGNASDITATVNTADSVSNRKCSEHPIKMTYTKLRASDRWTMGHRDRFSSCVEMLFSTKWETLTGVGLWTVVEVLVKLWTDERCLYLT